MTTQMTAWIAQGGRSLDDADAFTAANVPRPVAGPRDLVVQVEAVSVNPVDTKVRDGLEPGTSRRLGWDAAGTVVETGAEVTGFTAGDQVYYAGDLSRPGSNAQLHAVDERLVARKPRTHGWDEAAALPLTAITAWEALFDRLQLGPQSRGTLLALGAAGGVGSILIQLAKQLTGATVIGTASREESRDWVHSLGADAVIDHHDLADNLAAVSQDPIDWVFSPHTRGNIEAFAAVMRPFGKVVAIDEPDGLDILALKPKSISFLWELMFTRSLYTTPDMGAQGDLLAQVATLVDEGRIRSTARTVIHLDADGLREAHRLVASGTTTGKVVLNRHA